MKLSIKIQLILHKACQMRAQNTRLMHRRLRTIIPYRRILAECDADADDFLGDVFHVLADEVVAAWMKEDRKAPGIAEGDEVRFARVVFDV